MSSRDICAVIENAEPVTLASASTPDESRTDGRTGKASTERGVLRQIASIADYWRTPDGRAFVTVTQNGAQKSMPIRSPQFKDWIVLQYMDSMNDTPSAQSLDNTVSYLEALAARDGRVHDIFVRVAEINNKVYLDLADEAGRVVEVTPSGWKVIKNCDVKFYRPPGLLPLPSPKQGGSIA